MRKETIVEGPAATKQCHNICDFFGEFGFLTQFILAVLSFGVLLIKRYREVPVRPMEVFKLDAGKNALGALLAHFLNLAVSEMFAGDHDPCPWYFLNILFDTTVSVGINFLLLRSLERLLLERFKIDVKAGSYGNPPDMDRWLRQLGLWLFCVATTKFLLTLFFAVAASPLSWFATKLLSPLCFNPHLELFVVMVLMPLVLNAFQFWMQDNFLKYVANYTPIRSAEEEPILPPQRGSDL